MINYLAQARAAQEMMPALVEERVAELEALGYVVTVIGDIIVAEKGENNG